MTGAAKPMVPQLGSKPTMKVDRPMIRMVIRKVYLRPTISPSAAEHHRAERPHQEARGERQQGEDVAALAARLAQKNFAPMTLPSDP